MEVDLRVINTPKYDLKAFRACQYNNEAKGRIVNQGIAPFHIMSENRRKNNYDL